VVVVVPSIEGRVLRRPRTLFIIESFFAIFVCLRDGCALLSLYGVDVTFEASLVGGAAGHVVFAHHRLGLCCSFCDRRGGCTQLRHNGPSFLATRNKPSPPRCRKEGFTSQNSTFNLNLILVLLKVLVCEL
jgi:hypothetical protein